LSGTIGDGDPPVRCGFLVDVVDADSMLADDLQARSRAEQFVVYVFEPEEIAVGVGDFT